MPCSTYPLGKQNRAVIQALYGSLGRHYRGHHQGVTIGVGSATAYSGRGGAQRTPAAVLAAGIVRISCALSSVPTLFLQCVVSRRAGTWGALRTARAAQLRIGHPHKTMLLSLNQAAPCLATSKKTFYVVKFRSILLDRRPVPLSPD